MGGKCHVGFVLYCHLTAFFSNECARDWRCRNKGTTPEFNEYYASLSVEVKQVSQPPEITGINVADTMLALGENCSRSCKSSLWYIFSAISSVVQRTQLEKNTR
jgi:hypothetical protein